MLAQRFILDTRLISERIEFGTNKAMRFEDMNCKINWIRKTRKFDRVYWIFSHFYWIIYQNILDSVVAWRLSLIYNLLLLLKNSYHQISTQDNSKSSEKFNDSLTESCLVCRCSPSKNKDSIIQIIESSFSTLLCT